MRSRCIGGKFLGEPVRVFITLKDFAQGDGKPNLLEYIDQFAISPVGAGLVPAQRQGAGHLQEVPVQRVLGAGRVLMALLQLE